VSLFNIRNPRNRRKAAMWVVVFSLVGGTINVALYVLDMISLDQMMILNLVLSWLAITLTALDIWATTDVRAEQDSGDS
jgi:hypothetical protein